MGGPWRGAPPPFFPSMEPDAGSRAQINRIIPRVYLTSYEGVEDVEELKRIKCTHIAAIGHEFLDNSQHPAAKELAGVKFYNLDISDDDNAPLGPPCAPQRPSYMTRCKAVRRRTWLCTARRATRARLR